MFLNSKWRSILSVLASVVMLGDQQVIAETFRYVTNPTFSALSRKGRPKNIAWGGGKRSGCSKLSKVNPEATLMAIVPQDDRGGMSISATPTFWVYVPYLVKEPLTAVLSVRKAGDYSLQPIQKMQLTLNQSGLVGVQLSEPIVDRDLLEWSLTVVCDAEKPDRNPFVSGLVLVKPDDALMRRMMGLSQTDRVLELVRSGYWYDTLEIVAKIDGDVVRQQLMTLAGLKTLR